MAGFVECLDSEDAEEFVRLEEGIPEITRHIYIFFTLYLIWKNLKSIYLFSDNLTEDKNLLELSM